MFASENTIMKLSLTTRETQVLELISYGFTDKEIGSKLFLSHYTVTDHRYSLLKKLKGKNAASMIRRAFETGALNVDSPF